MNRPIPFFILAGLTLVSCAQAQPLTGTTVASASVVPASSTSMPPVPAASAGAAPTTPAGVTKNPKSDVPPWGLPVDTKQRITDANLGAMPTESFVYHVHSHLDVFYNGQAVVVPGLIGIDRAGAFISPLHTHDTDGVIHIEASQQSVFKLSQFFKEWGVSLDGFTAYVGGVKQDNADVLLENHKQIALVYGAAPAAIPSAYPATAP